jgi:hypothetical protein
MAVVWVLEPILLGCLLVWRFADFSAVRPRWARAVLIFGSGAPVGMGLSASLFLLVGVLLRAPVIAAVLEIVILAWTGYGLLRRREQNLERPGEVYRPLLWPITAMSLLLVLGIAAAAIWIGWEANPNGNWDAWAIWNLRARYLAADPALAARAWSPVLSATTHPEYPLLLSSFVGRCWAFSRSFTTAVPATVSGVFFLALMALVGGSVAALRGPTLGLLAALSLAATPAVLHEVPAEYADVPLACYMAGAVAFVLLDRPLLAGILAGMAAWTKDEGLLFLAVFLAATTLFRRRSALSAIAGALPAVALVVLFKTVLARGNPSLLSTSLAGVGHRLGDVGRYGTVMGAFGREFLAMASGWYHPVLPMAVLAATLRFDEQQRREVAYTGSVLGAMLAGYAAVYLVTANDLTWLLQTSLSRLLVQAWPLLILAGFVGLRAPEASAIIKAAPAAKVRKKATRR